jgi:hypothetical protein
LNAKEWIAAYAEALDTDAPTTDEFKMLLDVAAEAAHSSERIAAPVACWVAAKSSLDLGEALRLAREIAADG